MMTKIWHDSRFSAKLLVIRKSIAVDESWFGENYIRNSYNDCTLQTNDDYKCEPRRQIINISMTIKCIFD